MNLEELQKEAQNGNMVAQYNLAEYYGRRLKDITDEDEIYRCSREAMLWLKKSARQGYGPAMDAVNELNIRPDDDQPADVLPEPEPAAQPEPAAEPEPIPEPEPAPKAEPEPVPDIQPKPVPEPARAQETRRIPQIPEQKVSAEQFRSAPAAAAVAPEKKEKKGAFSSTSNAILCIILLISLILNVVLLFFISRLSKDTGSNSGGTKEPVVSSQPTAVPSAKPTEQAHSTPAPTPEATPEVVTTPEPDTGDFWLDLSKYPDLDVVPDESALYNGFVYYVVTASDSLNMRSGPDVSYKKLGAVPGAGKVGAVAKSNGWYLVNYNGIYGWVAGNYLTDDLNYKPASSSSTSSSGNLKTW